MISWKLKTSASPTSGGGLEHWPASVLLIPSKYPGSLLSLKYTVNVVLKIDTQSVILIHGLTVSITTLQSSTLDPLHIGYFSISENLQKKTFMSATKCQIIKTLHRGARLQKYHIEHHDHMLRRYQRINKTLLL